MTRSIQRSRTILVALAGVCAALTAFAAQRAGDHSVPKAAIRGSVATTPGEIGRRLAAAQPGATVTIEAGVYFERVRIERPIRLIARGAAVIDGGGSGDIVEIVAPDVTLQGFTIRNTGIDLDQENCAVRALAPRANILDNVFEDILFGVDLRDAPDSRIIGNRIGGKKLDIARRGDGLRLWRADRTLVAGNTIHDGRDAILWYSSGVVVRENTGFDCRYGLHLMFSDKITIANNTFTENSVGIYLMYSTGVELLENRLLRNRGPSGYGIGLKETDQFRVVGNLIAGNRSGIYIDGSPFTQTRPGEFVDNTIACNDIGITFLPSARGNQLSDNNFIDNIDSVVVAGRGSLEANQFWKGDRGNFWSDYTGYDQNADGIGDFVHESYTLFENLLEREPMLRLFLFSPAQQAIEFVGRAIPAVRPEPKFTDEVPLMRPRPLAAQLAPEPSGGAALLLSGIVLLGIGGSLIFSITKPRELRIARERAT